MEHRDIFDKLIELCPRYNWKYNNDYIECDTYLIIIIIKLNNKHRVFITTNFEDVCDTVIDSNTVETLVERIITIIDDYEIASFQFK